MNNTYLLNLPEDIKEKILNHYPTLKDGIENAVTEKYFSPQSRFEYIVQCCATVDGGLVCKYRKTSCVKDIVKCSNQGGCTFKAKICFDTKKNEVYIPNSPF